jgi:hypothetical protein
VAVPASGWLAGMILPGNMLARDAEGGVTVVLCSGAGIIEMVMAPDGSVKPVSKSSDGDFHGCHWAPHAQPLLQLAGPDAAPPPPQMQRLSRLREQSGHIYRAAVRSAPARAPPGLV